MKDAANYNVSLITVPVVSRDIVKNLQSFMLDTGHDWAIRLNPSPLAVV